MNSVRMLRILLVLAVVLSVCAGSFDALFPQSIPAQAGDAYRTLLAAREAPRGGVFIALAAAYELLVLAAVVGMFRLRRWGLNLGLVVTALTLLQAIALGPHVYSGAAFMLSYAAKVAWGAALAFAFGVTPALAPDSA